MRHLDPEKNDHTQEKKMKKKKGKTQHVIFDPDDCHFRICQELKMGLFTTNQPRVEPNSKVVSSNGCLR